MYPLSIGCVHVVLYMYTYIHVGTSLTVRYLGGKALDAHTEVLVQDFGVYTCV